MMWKTRKSQGRAKGTGRTQYVDLSEGTEDMELIQDVSDEVDVIETQPDSIEVSSSAIDNFFPLFGITLGKTTWKDAKEMGLKVSKFENEESRTINVEDVDFWDHDGVGVFTSLYWTYDEHDFTPLWKSKGFDWNLSYDKWIEVFEKLGFDITVTRQPSQSIYSRRKVLSAEFEALSPDKALNFIMDFNYGENGNLTSSPKTLYAITVNYEGVLAKETEDIEKPIYDEIPEASTSIDIKKLDYIFEKEATSYKYFWFMAIISLAHDKKCLTIPYRDIVIRMATLAWPIVFEYEIDLGKSDMIAQYLNDILKQSTLIKNISNKVVEAYLSVYYYSDGIDKILEPLLKNVPYRFLSPWIPYTTDKEVVEKSNSADYACLYALQENSIVLDEDWWEYIKKYYVQICYTTERSFITYLKSHNDFHRLAKFISKGLIIQ